MDNPSSLFTMIESYQGVRRATEDICRRLQLEDYVVQPHPDISPPRWHLAHTTWFFEAMILANTVHDYRFFDERYNYLFNSYYEAVGPRASRPSRGSYSRPSVQDILKYRRVIDERMTQLMHESLASQPRLAHLITLGLQHEQQHQELLWTDIKFILFFNGVAAPYLDRAADAANAAPKAGYEKISYAAGLYELGAPDTGFSFDNERPRQRVYVDAFALASHPVSNRQYLDFVADGGYHQPRYWLADGWAMVQEQGLQAPLYWESAGSSRLIYTLHGWMPLDPDEPVMHISYYEADAFCRWYGGGARLPTEFEWELAATQNAACLAAMQGSVWQWTGSAYLPYPRFVPEAGLASEYNGKFMCNQMVLRGSSRFTPQGHARPSYRNYFAADKRWQFTGLRLAWSHSEET